MKRRLRFLIRKILSCDEHQTIEDSITKHVTNIKKMFLKKRFGLEEFEKALIQLGIQEGDSIIVHCAWRDFYNFTGKPEDVIDVLLQVIGQNANLLMPCYGNDIEYFDVKETKSAAGVLSEVFRTKYPSKRSCCNHFSMAVMGPDTEALTKDHLKSLNGFDEFSPYAKAGGLKNCKILLLGLGRKPKKLSLIHVVEYEMRNIDQKCNALLSKRYFPKTVYYDNDGKPITESHEMIFWENAGHLIKKNIATIYKTENHYMVQKLSNVYLCVVDYRLAKEHIRDCINAGMQFTK